MPKAAPASYSKLQIRLHWAVVILVALQFLFEDAVSDAFRDGVRNGNWDLTIGTILHFVTGGLILLMMFARLAIRQDRGVPAPPPEEPQLFQTAAKIAHWVFYVLLIMLPISGGVAWGTGSETPSEVHEILSNALLALIAAHVLGALYHQFILKTDVLKRMRPS